MSARLSLFVYLSYMTQNFTYYSTFAFAMHVVGEGLAGKVGAIKCNHLLTSAKIYSVHVMRLSP